MVFISCAYMFFFFFKQKTAYEMRISDWSSDVCSSDLMRCPNHDLRRDAAHVDAGAADSSPLDQGDTGTVFSCLQRCCHSGAASTDDRHMQLTCRFLHRALAAQPQIGRASCRERVCTYV